MSLNIHNLVAEAFIGQADEDQVQVIHLDHDKFNNEVNNLRWATKKEAWEHQKLAPNYKPPKKGRKLTPERVRLIKKKILEGKTKQSLLAKQFGISEMGIYRIKTGKLWADIII
jgi:DNA invertase Pin-like site-specific DNA recombinase